jgi:hypothetical protein
MEAKIAFCGGYNVTISLQNLQKRFVPNPNLTPPIHYRPPGRQLCELSTGNCHKFVSLALCRIVY